MNNKFSKAARSVVLVKRSVFGFEDDQPKKGVDVTDQLDNMKDTADDEWWHTAGSPLASPLAGSGSPLLGGLPPADGEEDFSDDEEEDYFPNAAEYSEEEIKATRTMQRYGRKFLARLRGEEAPDILSVVRGFVARRKSILLKAAQASGTVEDSEDADAMVAQALLDAFGSESLAGRKPSEVEKYLEEFGVRKFVIEQLAEVFAEPQVPANPYPTIYLRMVKQFTFENDYEGQSDTQIIEAREKHLERVGITLPDGSEMPCAFLDDVPLDETFWGDKGVLATVDGMALLALRRAIADLIGSVVIKFDEDNNDAGAMTVGRALGGRNVFHKGSSPFPASIELSDECMASGPDFEVALRAYVEHVYNDLEEISSYGLHSFLSPMSVGIATPMGEFQRYSEWSMAQILERKRAFLAELSNSTVNKRGNFVDILFRVKVQEIPGATDREAEEMRGGWGFMTCRKYYVFHYHEPGLLTKSFTLDPFVALYRGVFFDKDAATMYATKRILPIPSMDWQSLHPTLLNDYLAGADANVFQANLSGDAMTVAEMSIGPAALRASIDGFDDSDTTWVRAQRIRGSGAHAIRGLCDHLFAMEKALKLALDACTYAGALDAAGSVPARANPKPIEKDENNEEDLSSWRVPPTERDREITNAIRAMGEQGLIVKRADGQIFQVAATVRVVMGQLGFVNREAGKIVVNGKGGVDLDSMGRIVMERIALAIREYMLTGRVRPRAVMRECQWLRTVLKSCYMTYAQSILKIAPIDVPNAQPVDSEIYFENLVYRDVVPIDSEIKKAVAQAKVPAGKARETMLLKYAVDTGIDEFLELLLNQLTQMYLFPLAKMRAMRSLRAYSQYFLLYKSPDLDIATAVARLMATVDEIEPEDESSPAGVCFCSGATPYPRQEGQPDPTNPQPGLWCPPGTLPPPPAYGTRVALTQWWFKMAGVGCAGKPSQKKDGSDGANMGSAARGGAHPNTDHHPDDWYRAHTDVMELVDSLRPQFPPPSGAYAIYSAYGVRSVVAHPCPFPGIMHLRTPRVTVHEYHLIEGPRKITGVQIGIKHVLAQIVHQHDASENVPFGIFVGPHPNPVDNVSVDATVKNPFDGHDSDEEGVIDEDEEEEEENDRPENKNNSEGFANQEIGKNGANYAGFMGATQICEFPGAGHRKWSPAQIKQYPEEVFEELTKAVFENRLVYTAGLYLQVATQDDMEQGNLSEGGYVTYVSIYNFAFAPSNPLEHGRGTLPDEIELMFARDDHAMFNNVFFSAQEASLAQNLYNLEEPSEEPCSRTNAVRHQESLTAAMAEGLSAGNFLDVLECALQRSILEAHLDHLPELLASQRRAPEYETRSVQLSNLLFAQQHPLFCLCAEPFRVTHSISQQLLAVRQQITTLALVFAQPAQEVRVKVRLAVVLTQAGAATRALLGSLMEESHRMCMDGLYRGVFNACSDLVASIEQILEVPTDFADPVKASLPAPEVDFYGFSIETDLSKTGDITEGNVVQVLRANKQLQESLEVLIQSISTSAFDNCTTTKEVVARDNIEFNAKQMRLFQENQASEGKTD